ncbi:MAG: hypothetical protein ACKOAD_06285, partial [Gammaproteobacteria bacterium]
MPFRLDESLSPLIKACFLGDSIEVNRLLSKPDEEIHALVNKPDHTPNNNRCTPLIAATLGGHTAIFEKLLNLGADFEPEININNLKQVNALWLSAYIGKWDIFLNLFNKIPKAHLNFAKEGDLHLYLLDLAFNSHMPTGIVLALIKLGAPINPIITNNLFKADMEKHHISYQKILLQTYARVFNQDFKDAEIYIKYCRKEISTLKEKELELNISEILESLEWILFLYKNPPTDPKEFPNPNLICLKTIHHIIMGIIDSINSKKMKALWMRYLGEKHGVSQWDLLSEHPNF